MATDGVDSLDDLAAKADDEFAFYRESVRCQPLDSDL